MFSMFAFTIFSLILVYASDYHEDHGGVNVLQLHVINVFWLPSSWLCQLQLRLSGNGHPASEKWTSYFNTSTCAEPSFSHSFLYRCKYIRH